MLRRIFLRLHLTARTPDIPVDDFDALGGAGALRGPRSDLDALDEQPHQLRRQLIDGGEPLEDVVLIEPFEQRGQLTVPLTHGIQLLLECIPLPPKFFAVFLIDIRRKLPLLQPSEVCRPLEIVQHDLAQLVLPDMVG